MLRGRESLIRLVGKRRRFLPHRQAFLSAPFQSSLNFRGDGDGEVGNNGKMESLEGGGGEHEGEEDSVEVSCPVCGNKVSGNNTAINSHIDVCLLRGTKRKLTQRTLLEMKFSQKSKVQIHTPVLEPLGNSLFDNIVQDSIHRLSDCGASVEVNGSNLCGSVLNSKSVTETDIDGRSKNTVNSDRTDINVDAPSLLLKNEVPECDFAMSMDDISGTILETFIVGRRFSNEKELNPGENIILVRDPHNAKDPNAIEVISSDTGYSKVLGFLPRELARYLSPLIDKCCLRFEGQVTSVPECSFDIVPIQVSCRKIVLNGNKENNSINFFRYLWNNALQVIESAKKSSTSTTKYQQNFCVFVQEVLRNNSHLFADDEKDFMESFNSLSDDSQRLFIRLYTRKGPWFRMSSISYPEILDPQKAVEELSEKGYTCSFEVKTKPHDDDLSRIVNLLTVAELREIMCTLKKIGSIMTISQLYTNSGTMSGVIASCANLLRQAWLYDLELQFWHEKAGSYCVSTFYIQRWILAIEVAQMIDESLDENNNELVLRCIKIAQSHISSTPMKITESSISKSVVSFHFSFSASWVYSKVILLGISFFERERRYNDAIYLLKQLLECFTCNGRRGYWMLRLSVDLEHIGCHDESLSVAENGLLDPWVRAGSRMALQRRVLRLGKPPRRWKIPDFAKSVKRKINEVHVLGRPLNSETGTKSRFYGEDGEQCGVEELALQYYAGEGGGWKGVHTESGIWLTIFGLLMWDVMFCDVPNVFRTRFQTAPLDLETDSFYLVRKDQIESHLKKIHDGMAEEILITSWQSHQGTACRGVNWDRVTLSDLRAAVGCIGGPCLALFCRHLAQDYRSWSSGMPDLLLWRFHDEYRAEAKLVEVKGPRDRLSEQQRAWLLLLMDCGFNTEVCKVSPEPTP
ncbi:fanconi-associated nuclease 1 homolog isoform X2 [Ziziphus jujuba]|uniref:Fanconi-associated nuclease n=1 Tax=Ziziphus jujuba TaxID=326968 RepID=A0ABM3IQA4_ZIZJJ|nr:fanconi-associated nuclease 1 homolog isoform X2 [Ziziphus jujuba]